MRPQVFVSFLLGLLSIFILILGAEPFETPGQSPVSELIAGGLAVIVYCGLGQFWVASRSQPGFAGKWPELTAMVIGTAIWIPFMDGGVGVAGAVLVVASAAGAFIGAALAASAGAEADLTEFEREQRRATLRRAWWVAAAMTVIVGIVLVVAVIPLARMMATQTAPSRPSITWPCAICGGLQFVIGYLIFSAIQKLRSQWPSVEQLIAPTLLSFILGMALAGATAAFWPHRGFASQPLPLLFGAGFVADFLTFVILCVTMVTLDAVRPLPSDEHHDLAAPHHG